MLSDLEILIKEKNATIEVGLLPKVNGYRRQLQQLFQNLISNALKYSKADVHPFVQISCRTVRGADVSIKLPALDLDKTYYLIEVKDNGIGFNQSEAELIFQMFQRLHAKNQYSGTGVGLAIVKKVVQNHNGFIWASSEPGEGATFNVLLPCN